MSLNQSIALVWFRRDLRLEDSEIINEATKNKQLVLPFFVIDPWFYQQKSICKSRVKFLFESLANLDANLSKRGSRLYLFEGESVAIIQNLTLQLLEIGKQPKIFFSRDARVDGEDLESPQLFEPSVEYGVKRDRQILDFYRQQNLATHLGLNHFMQLEAENYENWWQDYHHYQQQSVYSAPVNISTPQIDFDLPQLNISQLQQKYASFLKTEQKNKFFFGGEDNAGKTLDSFLERRYQGYHWKMSRPWMAQKGATSHLSPHLDFGTISSRIVYQGAVKVADNLPVKSKTKFSLKTFLDRLRWHSKFNQRHYFHPELAIKNRYEEFDCWYSPKPLNEQKQELFDAWCEGKTGFPMVDASMRQLNQMGWMNFRMRAMCVTFLTINCGVSWHHGAQYFMSQLIDGNIAINHWQWQAQAGVTNPMSNTFRIYNPTKNLQEKDPYLQFVHFWIPELRDYKMQQIVANEHRQTSNYPQPILDWKQTRKTNGKVVADLRKEVKERLEREQGEEYRQAMGAKETIEKYFAVKDRQYQQIKNKLEK